MKNTHHFSLPKFILYWVNCLFFGCFILLSLPVSILAIETTQAGHASENYDLKITLLDTENYQINWSSGATGWQKNNWGAQNTLLSNLQIENLTACRATPTLKIILPDPATLSTLEQQLEKQNWQLLVWDNQQRSQIYTSDWPVISRVLPLEFNSLEKNQLATYQLTLTNQTPIPFSLENQLLSFDLHLDLNFQYCSENVASTPPPSATPIPSPPPAGTSSATTSAHLQTTQTLTQTIYQPIETIIETTETIYQALGSQEKSKNLNLFSEKQSDVTANEADEADEAQHINNPLLANHPSSQDSSASSTYLEPPTMGWAGSSNIAPEEESLVGIIEETESGITGFFATSPILSTLIIGLVIGGIGLSVIWFFTKGLTGFKPFPPKSMPDGF